MGLLTRVRRAVAAFAEGEVTAPVVAVRRPDRARRVRIVPVSWQTADLKEERLLGDDSIGAVQKLTNEITVGAGWQWVGSGAEGALALTDAIGGATGFVELLEAICGSVFTRYALLEAIWDTKRGAWTPARFREVERDSAVLDLDEYGDVAKVQVRTTAGLQELPAENRVLHLNRPTLGRPLGRSAFDHLGEVIQYKRRADLALIRYLERFAVPGIIGYYAPGTPDREISELMAALKALQSASYGTVPGPKGDGGTQIDILQAEGTGGPIQVAIDMVRMYERRIARGVLGSVLAIHESEFGTRAQAGTHLQVLKAVVKSLQKPIEQAVTEQVLAPVLAYNGGPSDVRFQLMGPDLEDQEKVGRWVADLTMAGVLDAEADNDLIRGLFGIDPRTPKQAAIAAERRREKEEAAEAARRSGEGAGSDDEE